MAGRLQDRLCFITGASRGIGRAVARLFAAEGAHVIAMARTEGGLAELDDEIRTAGGIPPTLIKEDLTNFEALDQIGAALFERFGKLDVLVGNGGMLGTLTPMGHIKPKEWDKVLATNLTANYRLIRSFEPLLRQSDAGRAIFVTSGAADGRHPFWATYAVSKGALEVMVKTWATEMEKTSLRVNLINPGRTRTGMRGEAYPGEDPETLPPPEDIAPAFLALAVPECACTGTVVNAQG
ncbi:SDR family NAD(P)-dependent oxidoreductase [Pararhodospirillum photometricum]|uniref:Short-chain dehydrogenase/reductase SDR n=1 Tax=Pararhodospirillum photometricum DSM 122 TaxID=1150469 RepID=H6SJ77_PARPM|nr:SDR family NAD(P)-dependent oxidoreductase [Pararhodospirillum photometricum]CCG08042.1 Short-chain dehydrogenase/reductase SDR [Pararhodospirillum photometricum DSM 122]